MRTFLLLLGSIMLIFQFSCESANIEDKYYAENPEDTTPNPQNIRGKIAWFPLNGTLLDSTENNTHALLIGDTLFVDGLNEEHGKGLYLDGSTYLLINLGYYDTLSVVFWIKGDGELETTTTPTLFDYGQNAFSAILDASTGATSLTIRKNENVVRSSDDPSVEYLNSFYKYSFVYAEAGGNKTRVYFKGYTSTGDEIIYYDEFDFPGPINAVSEFLYIGRTSLRENQSVSFFRGAIDEIQIYNKTLSNSEVEAMALIPPR